MLCVLFLFTQTCGACIKKIMIKIQKKKNTIKNLEKLERANFKNTSIIKKK